MRCLSLLVFLSLGLFACGDDDEHNKELTLTIASEKILYNGDIIYMPYWAKKAGEDKWTPFDGIQSFEHEEGYEYVLRVWQEKWHNGEIMDAGIYRYKLLETLSMVKKDSENIPSQHLFIHIASRKTGNPAMSYYARFYEQDWKAFPDIEGFVHEVGHEYLLSVSRNFQGSDAPAKFTYSYIDTHKDEEKDSEGLPQ